MSMDGVVAAGHVATTSGTPRWVPISRWTLWTRPRPAICYILTVNALAVAGTVAGLAVLPINRRQLVFAGILVLGSLAYGEVTRGIERIRRQYAGVPHFDLSSVWMFAAALVTHPALTAVVVATVYAHPWFRIRHHPVHRRTFSAAAATLSAQAAAVMVLVSAGPFVQAQRSAAGFAVVAGAGMVFLLVNTMLITGVIAITTADPRLKNLFGNPGDYALEAATIALGILLAWTLADWPVALVLIFGVSLALHRNVLIRQLRDLARTDSATGLLNVETWRACAEVEVANAARRGWPVGLLILDLDHFKKFSDASGQHVADDVLLAVAAEVAGQVRGYDLVGRFGADEFAVLLPGSGPAATREIAERLRLRVSGLGLAAAPAAAGLSVSIGAANYPDVAGSLEELVQAADNALLVAKDHGRDQVQMVRSHIPS